MTEYEMEQINKSIDNVSENGLDNGHDDVSLPDITLYTFDSISDVVGATEVHANADKLTSFEYYFCSLC